MPLLSDVNNYTALTTTPFGRLFALSLVFSAYCCASPKAAATPSRQIERGEQYYTSSATLFEYSSWRRRPLRQLRGRRRLTLYNNLRVESRDYYQVITANGAHYHASTKSSSNSVPAFACIITCTLNSTINHTYTIIPHAHHHTHTCAPSH